MESVVNGMEASRLSKLDSWRADWSGLRVVVLGAGGTGLSVADTLAELGAEVLVVAESVDEERAALLDVIGVTLLVNALGSVPEILIDFDPELFIVSPGFHPDHPVLLWAGERGLAIWGDIELAWRVRDKVLRADGTAADWILVTGTNGKTTTVHLTEAFLQRGGFRAVAVGNVGTPVLDAVRAPEGFDVLVVELSSYQLHWLNRAASDPGAAFSGSGSAGQLVPYSAVCLNIADDHLDWHGGFAAYRAAKAKVYANTRVACVYNHADVETRIMVEEAEVTEGARAIGFGLGVPGMSDLGVVDDFLVDRAFLDDRRHSALELTRLEQLRQHGLAAAHLLADVLAASALARSYGVPPVAIDKALATFSLDEHRIAVVAEARGVRWIDDSKATNPHAANASLAAFDSVVWIVGGLLKGVRLDELLMSHLSRLRGVVLIGWNRDELRALFAQLAPEMPLREVDAGDTAASGQQIMTQAVALAAELAREGDTVLLAPAAASMDQFTDYAERGALFTDAVRSFLSNTK